MNRDDRSDFWKLKEKLYNERAPLERRVDVCEDIKSVLSIQLHHLEVQTRKGFLCYTLIVNE